MDQSKREEMADKLLDSALEKAENDWDLLEEGTLLWVNGRPGKVLYTGENWRTSKIKFHDGTEKYIYEEEVLELKTRIEIWREEDPARRYHPMSGVSPRKLL